jgi:hypothetical protein
LRSQGRIDFKNHVVGVVIYSIKIAVIIVGLATRTAKEIDCGIKFNLRKLEKLIHLRGIIDRGAGGVGKSKIGIAW